MESLPTAKFPSELSKGRDGFSHPPAIVLFGAFLFPREARCTVGGESGVSEPAGHPSPG